MTPQQQQIAVELVAAFDVEPRDVAQLPAETLGDLYAAAQQAAGAIDAAATILRAQRFPLVAAQLKESSVRLDHALRAAQDRTETRDPE